jgi:short-subunit dehydrogenase
MDVKGRVVVITGASGGIGAAIARKLATEGAQLVLAARRERELEQVAQETVSLGAERALPVTVDVTKRDQVFDLRDKAVDELGKIDVWVNNAGRGITRPVLELTDEDVDEMMSVNVKSALYGMQAAIPHFIERGSGHLINISSFLGRVPIASVRSVYSASKAALNSLTANLRMDLRAYPGIHVSLVMPGVVSTEFARHARGASASASPTPAGSPMMVQTADEVAARIADVIRNPVAEVYTNPASAGLARAYFADVAGFEEKVTQPQSAPDVPRAANPQRGEQIVPDQR